MPSYTKRTVAEFRQLCDDRQILCEGLLKPALIQALREYDETHEGNVRVCMISITAMLIWAMMGKMTKCWEKAVYCRGAMITGRVTVRVSPPSNHRVIGLLLAAEKGNCVWNWKFKDERKKGPGER